MQKIDGTLQYSASDLVNFLGCEHRTSLDLINLDTPLPKTLDTDEARLIQSKGLQHEARFLETLRKQYPRIVNVAESDDSLSNRAEATLAAMRDGAEIIFQGTLQSGNLIGHVDFLRRTCMPSTLGDYSYEVLDTKLARTAKGKFIVQIGFYTELLARVQGCLPDTMYLVLGNGKVEAFQCAEYRHYIEFVLHRFLACVGGEAVRTYSDPCEACSLCRWRELCAEKRISDDHLCQVANITNGQIGKLRQVGVQTLKDLASLPPDPEIARMLPEVGERLRHQAFLQYEATTSGQRQLALLAPDQEGIRGFSRLPEPDNGDLFFDMEGDPLEVGGLEYLFGVYFFENGKSQFRPFWAHSRAEERVAFEAFMDFVSQRLRAHPRAHIYHYAHYEEAALKKLMSLHGTRESEVDNLLRGRKLIDLYKVVREAIRVSEPAYSIKNIEHFYLEARIGEVTTAGASIVFYDRWKETGDQKWLDDIARYNFDDVRSTFELREWLLGIRPKGLTWRVDSSEAETDKAELTEAEARLVSYRERLVDALPEERESWDDSACLRELTYQLLDFHRRADKPAWWEMFARMEADESELIDDPEALGGLTQDPLCLPARVNRSIVRSYCFPEQETKLKPGKQATLTSSGESVTVETLDTKECRVSFKRVAKRGDLPAFFGLGPPKPLSTKALTKALFRFADSIVEKTHQYGAIEQFLTQSIPIIVGKPLGEPLLPGGSAETSEISRVVANLDCSYLFIQGPPGSGKTYTGSHVIVSLMKQGFKVGVSSNSHKAINNLLGAVEKVARAERFKFSGIKKSSSDPDSQFNGRYIHDTENNADVIPALQDDCLLVAGTAWLFARDELDQQLDYLFIDEAGQVALANLVAMGTSARNIVLLGDQMQLGQPIQGVHPGRSGESTLEYLLNGLATIAPERGIFLPTTWRMHPAICQFISDAVYDSRLWAEPDNSKQTLILSATAHQALQPVGIRYLPVDHEGCSQTSETEASLVREIVSSLLEQNYHDKKGERHAITLDDILVVSPYNLQVNLLKELLPVDSRVGTVDKFQGQEAEVVIISMATSSGDELPRKIDFLYSKNRLNVAISRARCLALFIANPALMSVQCSRPEQMAMVNTFCWLRSFSSSSAAADVAWTS